MTRCGAVIPWVASGDEHRDAAFAWVDERLTRLYPEMPRQYGNTPRSRFSRARARNDAFAMLHMHAVDVVLILDADTVIPRSQIEGGLSILGADPRSWVILYGTDRYYNLSRDATRRLIEQAPDAELTEPTDSNDWEHKITSWAGALLVPVEAWRTVNGYDTRFRGWGGEDNAFQLALDTLWAPHQRVDGFCLHLWHPRGDADFDQPDWPHNQQLLRSYQRANRHPDQMRRLIAR